jgi:hypothetical protein
MIEKALVSDSNQIKRRYPAAILSHSAKPKKQQGARAMARSDFGYLPRGNPCAQCGKPIATPEWIESGPKRASYLWHCWACDYQFEAVAFFDEPDSDSEALAA